MRCPFGRKFLDRRDDDARALGNRLFELPGRAVDLPHNALRLLELRDRALKLTVEHNPVSDDDRGIKDWLIGGVMQLDRMMGEPADGVGLAGACRVLDQVIVAGALRAGVGDQIAHGVELLEAREDQNLALAGDFQVHELPDHIEHDGTGEDRLAPFAFAVEIRDAELVLDIGISGPAVAAPVERQKACPAVGKPRRHRHVVFIERKVHERAALEGQKRLARRRAVGAILPFSMPKGRAGEKVLGLHRDDGQAVQEEHHVKPVAVLRAVLDLLHH